MQEATLLLLILTGALAVASLGAAAGAAVSLPGCPDKCGDVTIPYPFGIGERCAAASLNSYFILACDDTVRPPRPMAGDSDHAVEITDISLERGEMRVLAKVSYTCFSSNTTVSTNYTDGFNLEDTPFLPSPARNRFTVIGCNTLVVIGGYVHGASDPYVTGCYSYCRGIGSTTDGAPCTGMGCCETTISTNLTAFGVIFVMNQSTVWEFNPCFYAMLAEIGWYSFRRSDLVGDLGFINKRAKNGVPIIADWAVRNSSCPPEGKKKPSDYACVSANSHCMNASNGPGYICSCSEGYEGNPYLLNGCQDIDECTLRKQDPKKYEEMYPCNNGACQNTAGSYLCRCKFGTKSDGTNFGCRSVVSRVEQVVIGLSVCAIVTMALTCLLIIQLQRRRHVREREEYFKQNGGLKLYDEMRSRQVDTIRILTEKEIKRATDNYNNDRVLGCGGHGMVYRGILDDNKEVAVKKSKVIDDDCREEFINEIIILSQINHRNIVRLLGCCLEVDVPMLVYEFISNGTLSEFLHGGDGKFISLDLRLKIASQSAEALAYLHSSTSHTILHGDVKSLNILLNDEDNAKVADFGASALKSMDENEFIMFVQGTLGYLDPESFVSHRLTDKSDVYSFGVVLLELMTRKRAIYIDNFNEKKALSHTFLFMFHQSKHRDMLDDEIIDDAAMAVLEKLAVLAVDCLNPRGDDRPTMKEVTERIQMLRRLQMQLVEKTFPERVHNSYQGSSDSAMPVPLDEMKSQSMETATLVLHVDLAR